LWPLSMIARKWRNIMILAPEFYSLGTLIPALYEVKNCAI
jgi:hypothetical protein